MRSTGWFALFLAACGGSVPSPPEATREPFWPLDVRDGHLVDDAGRVVLLRGVNARVAGIFDVTFDDGRPPLEDIPELTAADCARMAELGFDVIRLPINWSGLEPRRDVIDEDYLAAIDGVVTCAADHGLLVLLDMHQDAWSKEIGEDGAPLWATQPPPPELLGGPLSAEELERRRTSEPVLDAFDGFFAAGDPHGLQAELADALAVVAGRWADHPAVVGIELFNEPVTDPELLHAFHARAAARVREAAPRMLLFFEPTAFRNFLDAEDAPGPFPVEGAVYAPHVYTTTASTRIARDEAEVWGAALFIGEFGMGPEQEGHDAWITAQLDAQEAALASSTFWLWKEDSQGRWGLHDRAADGSWQERPGMVDLVARPRVARVAGRPLAVTWTGAELTVRYDGAVDAPSLFMVREPLLVTGATCDGDPAPAARVGARVGVTCAGPGEHRVTLSIAPPK